MKSIFTFCVATITLICLFSCHKDKDNRNSELLKQKWNSIMRYDTVFYSSGSYTATEIPGQPGDYMEFGKDDSITYSYYGSTIRYSYNFIESNMTIKSQGGSVFQIRELTDHKLELYGGVQINNDNYISHYYLNR